MVLKVQADSNCILVQRAKSEALSENMNKYTQQSQREQSGVLQ